jgi:hypothetical protein
MTRRPAPAPPPGSLDLTLWGPDERCLLISGPLPLLGELLRTMQLPAAERALAGAPAIPSTPAPLKDGARPDGDAA